MVPGFDVAAFFTGLGDQMHGGRLDPETLTVFARRWGAEFLGPPLKSGKAATNANSWTWGSGPRSLMPATRRVLP